jgi:hypothetical protein
MKKHCCKIPGCGKVFSRPSHLQRYSLNYSNTQWVCERCSAWFKRRGLLGVRPLIILPDTVRGYARCQQFTDLCVIQNGTKHGMLLEIGMQAVSDSASSTPKASISDGLMVLKVPLFHPNKQLLSFHHNPRPQFLLQATRCRPYIKQ